jgi:hypothetical protein
MARRTRYTLCDKDSSGTPVSSTNKSDRRDINEILSKVALKTINPTASTYKHTLLVTNIRIRYAIYNYSKGPLNEFVNQILSNLQN